MNRDRGRRPKPLRRKVATRRPRKTLAVFCEGQRTEPEYLEALKRDPAVRDNAAVELRIETHGLGSVPLTLVRMAVEARERSINEDGEVDEFCCVFDVEWPHNHPGLIEAVDIAHRHGIKLAISNPCFELWLALHFCKHGSFVDNDAARRLRRSHDHRGDKGIDGPIYMQRKMLAAERAAQLDRTHTENGTRFPQNNPSSGMHALIAAVTLVAKVTI